jgi:solute carrier family 35, member E3
VFANKVIFEDQALRHAQVSFAALHFAITTATLYTASLPRIAMVERKFIDFTKIVPLATAMILAVVLTNASLAYSSIQFYQVARVLVTPCVSVLECLVLRKNMQLAAALTLVPVCSGVALVSYFDTSKDGLKDRGTSPLGVFLAGISLIASATYTVLIKRYHQITGLKSAQLLLNQSPASVLIMLYIIPFSDDITVWSSIPISTWMIILLVSFHHRSPG